MTDRYPLSWPSTQLRTPSSKRETGRFEVSFAVARDHLIEELRRLGAIGVIISTSVPLRRDGLPYANQKEPADPGVAVYFQLKRQPYVLACDRFLTVRDNLRAIGLHLDAMRGMKRWGVGSVEQAFTGYQALPESRKAEFRGEDSERNLAPEWWQVLGVTPDASMSAIKQAFREKAALYHPDVSGSHEAMLRLNRAWEEAKVLGRR